MTMVFEEKIFQDRSCAWRCLLCWGSSLERVSKLLFGRCASQFVGDLCQMKGA